MSMTRRLQFKERPLGQMARDISLSPQTLVNTRHDNRDRKMTHHMITSDWLKSKDWVIPVLLLFQG